MPKRGRGEFRACGGYYRCADRVILGQRLGGIGAFVRRNRSGGWEEADRLYGAVGENSIDFLEKLYRLFPDDIG